MKQGNIVQAYRALQKLTAETLPIKIACKLHRLKVQLRTAWDFQLEEEGKLIAKLRPREEQDGSLTFQNKEDCKLFRDQLAALADMDADDVKFDRVEMPMLEDISLSANDVEALEGFVAFTEAQDVQH